MLKKLIVLSVVGFVAVSVAKGTRFGEDVKETAKDVRDWFKEKFRSHPKEGPVSAEEIETMARH